jgi:hypothetical protein
MKIRIRKNVTVAAETKNIEEGKVFTSEVLTVKAEPVSMDKDTDGEVYYMMKVIEGEYSGKLTVKVYESDVIFEEGDTIV